MGSTVMPCPSCGKRNRVPNTSSGTPTCGACHRPMQWIVEASEADFTASATSSLLVLVDLWAPWCGPCRTISPLIEQAAKDLAGVIKVVKVNVDVAPAISQRFGVQGIPTLLLIRNGDEVGRQVGALPGQALRAWIDTELTHADR